MAPIFILGEAPGITEVERNQPFVGKAGRKLMELLAAAKIDIADCFFSNTVHCLEIGRKPPTPNPMELDACRPYLMETILKVKPKVVVCLGNTALGYWYPGFKIGKCHGILRAVKIDEDFSTTILPTYHPASILYGNKAVERVIVEDLSKINGLN